MFSHMVSCVGLCLRITMLDVIRESTWREGKANQNSGDRPGYPAIVHSALTSASVAR